MPITIRYMPIRKAIFLGHFSIAILKTIAMIAVITPLIAKDPDGTFISLFSGSVTLTLTYRVIELVKVGNRRQKNTRKPSVNYF